MTKTMVWKRGFTLVELIVTISLVSILLLVAIPSFSNLIESNKLRTSRDLLVSAINAAQQKALTNNVTVFLCPSADGASCDNAWNNGDGWLAYEDQNRNDGLDNGEIFLSQVDIKINSIQSDNLSLQFMPTGHATINRFTFCSNIDNQDDERISLSRMGRITYWLAGSYCP